MRKYISSKPQNGDFPSVATYMYFVLPLIKPKINSLHISDVFNIFSKAGGFHNKKHVLVDDIKLMIDYNQFLFLQILSSRYDTWCGCLAGNGEQCGCHLSEYVLQIDDFFCLQNAKMAKTMMIFFKIQF